MHNKFLGTSLSDISGSYSCDHSVNPMDVGYHV